MPIDLFRIDDRLIHGQVVVGWGQPMSLGFIVLVDDEVAASEWEQELYRMGVPPEMDAYFASVAGAAQLLDAWRAEPRPGMLLTADVDSMQRLIALRPDIRQVNIGGLHHRPDRKAVLRYVYLAPSDVKALRSLEKAGVEVTAQDVPTARPIPLQDLFAEMEKS